MFQIFYNLLNITINYLPTKLHILRNLKKSQIIEIIESLLAKIQGRD